MKVLLLLLSLMFFVALATDFSLNPNLPLSQFASEPSENGSTTPKIETAVAESPPSKKVVQVVPKETKSAAEAKPLPQTPPPAPKPPTATPPASQSPSFEAEVESEILRLTNIERAKYDLSQLSSENVLAATAEAHSEDMLDRDFFSHDNPDGCSSSCRATAAGYSWQAIGENIFMLKGWDLTAEETAIMIVNGWLGSPGHKENMLKPVYTETGVGVFVEDEAVYATTLYAKPR
ncbi:MAG: CAP domain-containing protein [Minisyncoccia bacterium]